MSSITKNLLSKGEQEVYEYIKDKTENGKKLLKEPMKIMGETLGTSEATIHRAVTKLVNSGIISVIPSSDKYEPNSIQYFGDYDSIDVLSKEPFFDMIIELNKRAERFKNIIETYSNMYEDINRENEKLIQEVAELKSELKAARSGKRTSSSENTDTVSESFITYEGRTITNSDILGVTDIDEELIAFIIKRNN